MGVSTSKDKKNQTGAGSAFMHNFYSRTHPEGSSGLTRHTLEGIDSSPMFNPLNSCATIPTPSTGIIPSAAYLAVQTGGAGTYQSNYPSYVYGYHSGPTLNQIRDRCNVAGISVLNPDGTFKSRQQLLTDLHNARTPFFNP